MNLVPGSRSEAIRAVYRKGWGAYFVDVFGRAPEAYFSEYGHREPGIWVDALRDLESYAKLKREEKSMNVDNEELVGALNEQPVETGPWETFCDPAYYHMHAVRRTDKRSFGDAFHLRNKDEAEGLVDFLNRMAP